MLLYTAGGAHICTPTWPSVGNSEGVHSPQGFHAPATLLPGIYTLQGTDFETEVSTGGCGIYTVSHDRSLNDEIAKTVVFCFLAKTVFFFLESVLRVLCICIHVSVALGLSIT